MLFPTLALIATLLSTANAVAITAWQGTGCDDGTSAYYANVPSNNCVAFSNSFGVRFSGVPTGAKGQVYYNTGCSNYAQEGGSGTYCLDAHNNMKSANWFYPSKRLALRESETGELHTGFTYTTPEGEKRSVLCNASEFEKMFGLVDAQDWAALAEYPEDTDAPTDE